MSRTYFDGSSDSISDFSAGGYGYPSFHEGSNRRRRGRSGSLYAALDRADLNAVDGILDSETDSDIEAQVRASLKARGMADPGVRSMTPYEAGKALYEIEQVPTLDERKQAAKDAMRAKREMAIELRRQEAAAIKQAAYDAKAPQRELSLARAKSAAAKEALRGAKKLNDDWLANRQPLYASVSDELAKAEETAKDTVGIFKAAFTDAELGDATPEAKQAAAKLSELREKKAVLEREMLASQGAVEQAKRKADEAELALARLSLSRQGISGHTAGGGQPGVELPEQGATSATHIGAQPVAMFNAKYGVGANLNDEQLVGAYETTKRRLSEISATLEDERTDERVAKSMNAEADELGKLLSQRETEIKQRKLWDKVRDPSFLESAVGAYANVARGAIDTVSNAAEFAARNSLRLNEAGNNLSRSMFGDWAGVAPEKFAKAQTNVASGFDTFNKNVATEDFDSMAARAAMSGVNPIQSIVGLATGNGVDNDKQELTQKIGDNFATGTMAQGIGSTIPFMATGGLGKGLASTLGMSEKAVGTVLTAVTGAAAGGNSGRTQAEEGLRDMLDKGQITQDEFNRSVNLAEGIGAIAGTTDALPLSNFFERAASVPSGRLATKAMVNVLRKGGAQGLSNWLRGPGSSIVRKAATDIGVQGVEEMVQEMGQSAIGNAVAHGRLGGTGWEAQEGIASDILGGDMLESGAAGGATGALLAAIMGAPGMAKSMRRAKSLRNAMTKETVISDLPAGAQAEQQANQQATEGDGISLADDELADEIRRTYQAEPIAPAAQQPVNEVPENEQADSDVPENEENLDALPEGKPASEPPQLSPEEAPEAATSSAAAGNDAPANASNEEPVTQPEEVKRPGKRVSVGIPANGVPDILNAIEELGGIKSKGTAMHPGGEYDDFAGTFTGAARNLITTRPSAQTPDTIIEELAGMGYRVESTDHLYQLVSNAVKQREKIRIETKQQMRDDKFEQSFAPGTDVQAEDGNPIPLNLLQVGDKFRVKGGREEHTVSRIDQDGTVYVSGIKKPIPADRHGFVAPGSARLVDVGERPLEGHPADTQTQDAAPADATLDPETGEATGQPRPKLTPVALVAHVSKAAKLSSEQHAEPLRIIGNLATTLHAANKDAFEGMQVVTIGNDEWQHHEALSVQTPNSAGAYFPEKNILYLNADKLKSKDAVNVFVHEAGHFAERFALGEDFAQAQWETLTDEQRSAAFKQYTGKGQKGVDLKNNRRARSEWVAMQFSRVVRGETEGMDGSLKLKLQKWLGTIRQYLNRWIGDGELTTKELDAKILEMLGTRSGQHVGVSPDVEAAPEAKQEAAKAESPKQEPKPGIVDRGGQTGLAGMDDTFNLASEQQADGGAALDKEQAKRDAAKAQVSLFGDGAGKSTAPTKLDAANEAARGNVKPERKGTGKLSASDDQAIRDAFSGLLGAPSVEHIEQKGLPPEKIGAFVGLANQLIGKGITSPQELSSELDRVLGEKARHYSQALWDAFGMVRPDLRGTHDWTSIYNSDKGIGENAEKAPLHERLRSLIESNDDRSAKARQIKKLADEEGMTVKQVQEATEAELVRMVDRIASDASLSPREVFDRSIALYDKQPLFSARTSTSVENQAYSTPAPLAVALAHMTHSHGKQVYEPTAGTGMLLVGADLDGSRANEIDKNRADFLGKLGVGTITTQDAAADMGAGGPKAKKFPVVHANPPFGSIANVNFDGFGIKKLEHIIALRALEAMSDNGRAALILGATREGGESSMGAQWVFENYLYSHYNVVGNFEVAGELYSNQGTKWPVRVIAIAGRKATQDADAEGPKSVDRLSDWNSVWSAADKISNDTNRSTDTVGTGGPAGHVPAAATRGAPAKDQGRVPGEGRGNASRDSRRVKPAGGGVGKQQNAGSDGIRVSGDAPSGASQESRNPAGAVPESGAADDSARGLEGQPGRGAEPAENAGEGAAGRAPASDARQLPVAADHALDAGQIPYVPRAKGSPFGTLSSRPIGVGTHAALDALVRRVGPIAEFVSGKLNMPISDLLECMSADQIDGAALAIDQIDTGGALIIGDETGIGKGRQAAAVIRYAITQGKIPVFFTLDPKLFSDMYGDLRDIKTTVKPLLFGEPGKASIVLPSGEVAVRAPGLGGQVSAMARIDEVGMARAGYDSIFITYSQVNKRNARQHFLERLAENSPGIIAILDEAHSAAGNGESSMQAAFMFGGQIKSGSGSTMKVVTAPGLLRSRGLRAGRGGVVYLSATYAKRPDNMPLYFRTSMSKASESFDSLVAAMNAGGVALQQAISEALASAGQYIRRERDFSGINFNSSTISVDNHAKLVGQMDAVTDALDQIVTFSKLVVSAVKEMSERGMSGTAMSETSHSATDFASIVHNQIGQLLLSAKADEVVKQVLASKARGEKPVITLMNTMESFLDDYVAGMNVADGYPISLSWKELLNYALSRTLRVKTKQKNGDTSVEAVSPESLGLQRAFDDVAGAIDEIDVDFPVSPIDYITQRLSEAGVRIGELTGRTSGITYTDYKAGKGTYRRFAKANKNLLVNGFNSGALDALLLNASGSTGLSIHAAPKFKDSRKRHMFIVQPALDINVVVQTLGRIKRTGMIKGGAEYTHLKLPLQAELRPAAVLAKKMKSLNANTTAESEGGVSIQAVDMLNKYGDSIVAQYLAGDPALQGRTGIYVIERDDGSVHVEDDVARKFMGRIARLPDAEQVRIYGDITPAYNALIDQLKQSGDYDLDIVVHDDWDGVMTSDQLLKHGADDSNLFTSSVRAQKWEITDKRPVPTGKQMLAEFRENHGSKEEFASKWADFVKQADANLDAELRRAEAKLAEAQGGSGKPGELALAGADVATVKGLISKWNITRGKLSRAFASIGDPVTITQHDEDGSSDPLDGMLVGVTMPDISGGSLRVSPSRFQLKYLVNQPGGRVTISGAQVVQDKLTQARSTMSVDEFTGDHKEARYERFVITGNPIAAYEATGGKGKVVRFRARDGSVITGLLMRSNWQTKDLVNNPMLHLVSGEAVARFIQNQRAYGPTMSAETAGSQAKISLDYRGNVTIQTPSSVKGRDFFLDPQLRALVGGDFFKSGNRMIGNLARANIAKAADRMAAISGASMRASAADPRAIEMVQAANSNKPSTIKASTSERQDAVDATAPSSLDFRKADTHEIGQNTASRISAVERELSLQFNRNVALEVVTPVSGAQNLHWGAGAGAAAAAVRHLELIFKKKVVFYRGLPEITNGFSLAAVAPNLLFINADSAAPIHAIFGHELVHDMERSDKWLHASLIKAVNEIAPRPESYDAKRLSGPQPYKPEKLAEEWAADVVAGAFDRPEFYYRLEAEMQKAGQLPHFHRLINFVFDWTKKIANRLKLALSADAYEASGIDEIQQKLADIISLHASRQSFRSDAFAEERQGVNASTGEAETLTAKGSPVPGTEDEFYRSLPISANRAGIEVALETYKRLHNKDVREAADAVIDGDEATAIEIATGKHDSEMPEVARNAIAVRLLDRLSKRLVAVSPEEASALRATIQQISTLNAARATEQGQQVQIWGLLSPTAKAIRSVVGETNKRQDAETGGIDVDDVEKRLRGTLPDPKDMKDIVEKATKAVRVSKSVWQLYREDAAKRTAALFEQKPASEKPALQDFTARAVAEIRAKLEGLIEKRPPAERPTAAQVIGESLANAEKYAELWETARAELAKKFAGNEDMLTAVNSVMADLGVRPYSKKLLDAAIRDAHKRLGIRVQELAHLHFSKADEKISDLAKDIVRETGIAESVSATLAKDIVEQAQASRKAAQQKIIERMKKAHAGSAKQTKVIHAIEKAIKLNNLGALTQWPLRDFVAKELKLPQVSADQLKRIAELGDKVEMAKDAASKHRAELELLQYMREIKGINTSDVVTAMFFANMLSGPKTHAANIAGNAINGTLQMASVIMTNPKQAKQAIEGYLAGLGTGFQSAHSIIKTGVGPEGLDAKTGEGGSVLEHVDFKRDFPKPPTPAAKALQTVKMLRYVTRAMRAADAIFYAGSKEAYTRVAVAKLLESQYEGKELAAKVREVLHVAPDTYLNAKREAEKQGWTGIELALQTTNLLHANRAKAVDAEAGKAGISTEALNNPNLASERFALETTYNNNPEGLAGIIYHYAAGLTNNLTVRGYPVAKVALPFLRIPTNIFNSSANWTPVGALRAATGRIGTTDASGKKGIREFTADERNRLLFQSVAGSVLMLAIALRALSDDDDERDFDISAGGPKDWRERQQLESAGWLPYSIKFGNRWISYKDSGLLMPLAVVGNAVEKIRASKHDITGSLTSACLTAPQAIFETSMLSGLSQVVGYVSGGYEGRDGKALAEYLVRVPSSVVVPNFVNQVERAFFDDRSRTADTFGQRVKQGVPFLRQSNPLKSDVLGQDIHQRPRFTQVESSDPVERVLADRGVIISVPQKSTKINGREMTPEQYRDYVRISGEGIKRRLGAVLPTLKTLPTERREVHDGVEKIVNPLDMYVDKIVIEERARAKMRVLIVAK